MPSQYFTLEVALLGYKWATSDLATLNFVYGTTLLIKTASGCFRGK